MNINYYKQVFMELINIEFKSNIANTLLLKSDVDDFVKVLLFKVYNCIIVQLKGVRHVNVSTAKWSGS